MRYSISRTIFQVLISISILLTVYPLYAAGSYQSDERFKKAVDLYNRGLYESAEREFENLQEDYKGIKSSFTSEIEAYLTLISILGTKPDLHSRYRIMEERWPDSPRMSDIRLKYGSYLFNIERYTEAFEVFSMIKTAELTRSQINEFNFKSGYANFRTGNTGEALSRFNQIMKGSPNNYTNPAIYYTAHIHYMNRNFEKAVEMFRKIGQDPRFSLLGRYYILESKFMLKDYKYVTENGTELYETLSGELKSKCARVVSEAFFALNDTERAEFYLKSTPLTIKTSPGKISTMQVFSPTLSENSAKL